MRCWATWGRIAVLVAVTHHTQAAADDPDQPDQGFSATAQVAPEKAEQSQDSRARSTVDRLEMDERIPRSAPDALRYEPGVSVQQTAHGQGSPYVRGLTGQQVIHLFDGVRLNNGTFRQGPNQYFFTVDPLTIDHIDVIRGSASTHYGSDALGGAILAYPIEPWIDSTNRTFQLRPKAFGKIGSADGEIGGRIQLESSIGSRTAALVGGGYRSVGLLESGGVVKNDGKAAPAVPRFADDGRTQLGTGFNEATFDGRVVHALTRKLQLVSALYGYRQYDAPRTDQCPPPEAPTSDCLWIDEQFRTLGYLSLRGSTSGMRDINLTAAYQRYEEARRQERPRSYVRHQWQDTVDTLSLSFRASTRDFSLSDAGTWKLHYGAESLRDGVQSNASTTFTDLNSTTDLSRGQYVDGASYLTLGTFAEAELNPLSWLILRGGGRASVIGARSAADPVSNTEAVTRNFGAVVGRAGAEMLASPQLRFLVNIDQGFRAPNLDDLTSRTQAGPGFQFENPDLGPERSTTFEIGSRYDHTWIRLEAWAFATLLDDAIIRAVRETSDCPPETPACGASRTRYQLLNADGTSVILGSEGGLTLFFPEHITLRATASYAWGESPNTANNFGDSRVPLSRVPPFNGTVETRYRHVKSGFYTSGVLRWALAQQRLAPSDLSDPRIPPGGTPGYGVFDLRAGWRMDHRFAVSMVLENLFDAAYRVHGSSINGPARSLIIASTLSW